MRPLMLKVKSSEKSQKGPNFVSFLGLDGGQWLEKFQFLLQKAHLYVNPRCVSQFV